VLDGVKTAPEGGKKGVLRKIVLEWIWLKKRGDFLKISGAS